MEKAEFRRLFTEEMDTFRDRISTPDNQWTVKGFIDIYRNVYTISKDTKVISKLIELMLFPVMASFAQRNNLAIVLGQHQNHYPDMTFVCPDGSKFAVDFKSTYRISETEVNGFTLGAFTGYFRNRQSNKNITFPYRDYSGHFVLGVIYSRSEAENDERVSFNVDNLENIASVAVNFQFIFQEKWQLATDKPGSGNTKNIGSVKNIRKLISGLGTFSDLGEDIFDDYWMNFITPDMARELETEVRYKNLRSYREFIALNAAINERIN